MGQYGLHATLGLLLRRFGFTVSTAFVWGIFIGCVFCDFDIYLSGPAYMLTTPAIAMTLHRTWNHSLISALAYLIIFNVVGVCSSSPQRSRSLKHFAGGLFLGYLCHANVDAFIWFAPIDLAWPLTPMGITAEVYLWPKVNVPDLVGNLLTASEVGALSVYYTLLRMELNKRGFVHYTEGEMRRHRRWVLTTEIVMYTCFVGSTVVAALLQAGTVFMVVYVPLLCLYVPWFWITAYRLRDFIGGPGDDHLADRQYASVLSLNAGGDKRPLIV